MEHPFFIVKGESGKRSALNVYDIISVDECECAETGERHIQFNFRSGLSYTCKDHKVETLDRFLAKFKDYPDNPYSEEEVDG